MFTLIEAASFTRLRPDYWDEDELGEFTAWLALNPEAGAVIPGSGGCRKVRWTRPGKGKRGGVRIIHYNQLAIGVIHLLLIYAKSAREDVPAKQLARIRRVIDGEDD